MKPGAVIAICIGGERRAELESVPEVEAVAGRGLVGDRYFRRPGAGNATQEITLIESEAIAALSREHDITLRFTQSRRNLITQGVFLNDLVGKQFTVGAVVLRGLELCDPCRHLERLTCKGVLAGLDNRGGLRAEIVVGGILKVGDPIRPVVDVLLAGQ
jgi:MOSC domain-containing protein YiiM